MRYPNQMHAPRVFIIEDSVTDSLLMSVSLQRAGYEVDVANDGRDGIKRVLEQPPHCLILDLVLPSMNGYTICRQLRSRDPHHSMPIVIVSTKRTPVDQKYMFGLGADRYLVKPFTGDILVQTVLEVLPETMRPTVAPSRPMTSNITLISPELATLIPYRFHEETVMLASSPFVNTTIVLDKQARKLYATIDGNKSVHDLSQAMQLDILATQKLLKVLWKQRLIAFYDQKRRPLKDIPELENL